MNPNAKIRFYPAQNYFINELLTFGLTPPHAFHATALSDYRRAKKIAYKPDGHLGSTLEIQC